MSRYKDITCELCAWNYRGCVHPDGKLIKDEQCKNYRKFSKHDEVDKKTDSVAMEEKKGCSCGCANGGCTGSD